MYLSPFLSLFYSLHISLLIRVSLVAYDLYFAGILLPFSLHLSPHVCVCPPVYVFRCVTFSLCVCVCVHVCTCPLFWRPIICIQTTLTLLLPADVWREVLEYADSVEYTSLTRVSAGVSKEFYWLLKNSLSTIRVHHPVSPLYGLVWLQSRDRFFSRVKRVEGVSLPPHPDDV